mmetsp:Transcript_29/g.73  ORF Transcript_29/g.73 Transcript_29/m.73 type:complete len:200 (-) Transcript_29:570-1169(-)
MAAHVRLVPPREIDHAGLGLDQADAVDAQREQVRDRPYPVLGGQLAAQVGPLHATLLQDRVQLEEHGQGGEQGIIPGLVRQVISTTGVRQEPAPLCGALCLQQERRVLMGKAIPWAPTHGSVNLKRKSGRLLLGLGRSVAGHEIRETLQGGRGLQGTEQFVGLCQELCVQPHRKPLGPHGLELMDAAGQVRIKRLQDVE